MRNAIRNKHIPSVIFVVLIFLVFFNRLLTLKTFGFQFVGSDDLTFWQMAQDYSKGIFHEPFFYGQNYNFGLESLFAVPLVWLGIPVYFALPIVSTLVGLFPFLLFAFVLFRKGFAIPAYFFLLLPLAMPIEYDLMTTMTRGFNSGLFFSAFLIFPLLNTHSKVSFTLLGFAVSFGYVFNANSLILAFPVCLYLFFVNFKRPSFYLMSILFVLPGLVLKYFAEEFYAKNPDFIVHSMWPLDFKWDRFVHAFQNLDVFFRYLTPFYWAGNWIIVGLIFLLGLAAFKKDWRKGVSLLLATFFTLLLLGINKVNDGIDVIFLSSSRMFLALPMVLGLAFLWTKDTFAFKKIWTGAIVVLAVLFLSVKISRYPVTVAWHTKITNFEHVAIKNRAELTSECSVWRRRTELYKADLLVFIPAWNYNVPHMEFYNYGCPCLEKNLGPTMMSMYERRTWVYREELHKTHRTVLLFNPNLEKLEAIQKELGTNVRYELVQENPSILLIQNNDKTLTELSKLFEFSLKRNAYQ